MSCRPVPTYAATPPTRHTATSGAGFPQHFPTRRLGTAAITRIRAHTRSLCYNRLALAMNISIVYNFG